MAEKTNYLELCAEAYESSTSYVDSNYRKNWEDSIRMFQSKHPKDSKYLSDAYKHRSKIFRPKTRSVIRKNEAAAAGAFFSNNDVVLTEAVNPADRMQLAGAELMKEVLNYRLQKTIPWFQIVVGAIQDAQVVGVVASYQYWKYKTKTVKEDVPTIDATTGLPAIGEDGNPVMMSIDRLEVIEDKPCIELLPVENVRIDPAADWLDPIGTSPYVIRIIPMYVMDVKSMMAQDDNEIGRPKWRSFPDDVLRQAMEVEDSTRSVRNKGAENPYEEQKPMRAYDVVFVHENFLREGDGVKVVYTLGTQHQLSDVMDLKDVYFHNEIPITMGCCVIETHRPMPSSLTELGGELQREANEVVNQRLDNVKLVLNKRYIAKRGAQVDLQSLVRNVPGSVTLATDPTMDVKEMEFNDVTSSSYQEQDRINVDYDELLGNFSAGSVQTNRKLNETVGGMQIISSGASQLTEYLLKTFTETWVEKTLRQLIKLEAEYETDEVILAIAANKAQLFPKYGISQVTDSLLNQDLTLTVNVGIGATDPTKRMQKFLMAAKTYAEIRQALPESNTDEVQKEIFMLAGYRDGDRFFKDGEGVKLPPELQQQIQQMQQQFQQLQQENQKLRLGAEAKMQEINLDRQVAQEEARLKREQFEFEKRLQIDKTLHQIDLDERKATAAHSQKQMVIDFDQDAKMKEAKAKSDLEAESEVGPKVEQALGSVMQAGFEQLGGILTQLLQVSQATLAAQEARKQVSITGIKVTRGADGKITNLGADVTPTLQ